MLTRSKLPTDVCAEALNMSLHLLKRRHETYEMKILLQSNLIHVEIFGFQILFSFQISSDV